MELNKVKALMAASLLGGIVATDWREIEPKEIEEAVKTAQAIWEEVLKQEHHER
jgi:hypothetical protein